MVRINCKQYDQFGACNKKPKIFFGLFRQSCVEVGTLEECSIIEPHSQPPTSRIKTPPKRAF